MEGISSDQPINEEVLQRLQEAENEAAELRKQLADMKTRDEDTASSSSSTTGRGGEVLPNNPSIKVDSVSSRENFLYPTSDVWLGEKDALLATKQFLAKDGLSESSYQSGVEEEDKPVVLRRLLIGVVGTIGAGLLGMIPTEKLDLGTPKQPMFAYLVPIIEAKDQYQSIEDAVENAELEVVQRTVTRILGEPTNLKSTMMQALLVVKLLMTQTLL